MRKIFSLLLCAAMTVSVYALDFTVDGINYTTIDATSVKVTGPSDFTGALVIPATVENASVTYNVTTIGDNAFENGANITSITFNEGLQTIGAQAFHQCTNLTTKTLVFPASVTSIQAWAFDHTNATSIDLSACTNLTLGGQAFQQNFSLTTLLLPEGLTSIPFKAFYRCTQLTEVTIPSTVTSIGQEAFNEYETSSKLIDVHMRSILPPTINATNAFNNGGGAINVHVPHKAQYQNADVWKDYVEAGKIVWVEDSITDANGLKYLVANPGKKWLYVPTQKKKWTNASLVVPDSLDYYGTKWEVRYIDNFVFQDNANITNVDLGCPSIYTAAFRGCTNLATVTLREGVKYIYTCAFTNIAAETIHLPKSLEDVNISTGSQSAFYLNNFKTFTVEEGNPMFSVGDDGALYYKASPGSTDLYLVAFPYNHATAFSGIKEGVTHVCNNAFYDCQNMADTIVLPASLKEAGAIFHGTTSGSGSLGGANVKCVVLNYNTYNVSNCFQNNHHLQEIIIGKNCHKLGSLMFKGAEKVKKITILSETMPEWKYGTNETWPAFGEYDMWISAAENPFAKAKVYVHCGQSATYTADANKWANFTNIIDTLLYDVNVIAENATYEVEKLSACSEVKVTVTPNSGYSFVNWDNGETESPLTLTVTSDTTIRANIKKEPVVGDTITYTYKGNTLYYKITKKNASGKAVAVVNEGLDYPIYWTDAHKPTGEVFIPDSIEDFMGTKYGVTEIGYEAFRTCTGITSIDFSENTHITSTSGNMCDGCTSLTSVILSDYITTISSYGFRECPLSSIDLKNVKKIGMSNFEASTFTTVHIPASLEKLEDQSYLCYHATTVTCAAENTHFAAVDNVLYNKELTKVIALPCGYTAGQEVHLPSTVTSMTFSALRDFTGKLYINSEITCNDTGWRNSPIGAVVVGCGLYDYYTTGDYAGPNSNFLYVTSLTESLLLSVTATAGVGGNVAILDTTSCNEVRIEATPTSGYKFVNWSNGETANPLPVTVTKDTTLKANFAQLVNAIEATVTYPQAGQEAAANVGLDWTGDQLSSGYTVLTADGLNNINTEILEPNTSYLLQISFYPKEGYLFGNDVAITVNGAAVTDKLIATVERQTIRLSFTTSATALDQITNDQSQTTNRKFLRDGQLIIEKNGKFYNAQGAEVR